MEAQNPAFATLFNPTHKKVCILCKKDISASVRIMACVDKEKSEYFNFCPACLCRSDNPFQIYEYEVCNSLTQQPSELRSISIKDIGQALSSVQKNGIESAINNPNCPQICEKYKDINDKIFADQQGLKVQLEDRSYDPARHTPLQKSNAFNKKQLESLGFCWERKQFSSLPQSIYEHMLGKYDEYQVEKDKDQQLMRILTEKYAKEQEVFTQVQQHMLNSGYLQARRDPQIRSKDKKQIVKLIAMKEPIKQLINCASRFIQNDYKPRQLKLFNAWKLKKDQKKRKKMLSVSQQSYSESQVKQDKEMDIQQIQNIQSNGQKDINQRQQTKKNEQSVKKSRQQPKDSGIKQDNYDKTQILLKTRSRGKKEQLQNKKKEKADSNPHRNRYPQ